MARLGQRKGIRWSPEPKFIAPNEAQIQTSKGKCQACRTLIRVDGTCQCAAPRSISEDKD